MRFPPSTWVTGALLPALALEAARDPQVTTIGLRRHTPRRVSLTSPADMPPSPAPPPPQQRPPSSRSPDLDAQRPRQAGQGGSPLRRTKGFATQPDAVAPTAGDHRKGIGLRHSGANRRATYCYKKRAIDR